jgi:hypothetical protein
LGFSGPYERYLASQAGFFGERFRTGLDAFVRQRTVHAGEILLGPNYLLLCPRHLPLGAQFQKPLVVQAHGELAGVYERYLRINERIIDEVLGGQIRRTGHHLHGLNSVTAHYYRRSNTRLR